MEQSDGDLADAYRPPSIEADAGRARPNGSAPGSVPPFFVVEPSKLVVMCVGTMGFYQIYWFYRHWRQYRTWSGERLSPGLRAAFTLFFTHRLFAAINAADARSRVSQERSGSDQTDRAPWSHSGSATLFVVLSLLGGGLQRATAKLAPASIFEFLGSLLPLVAIFPQWMAEPHPAPERPTVGPKARALLPRALLTRAPPSMAQPTQHNPARRVSTRGPTFPSSYRKSAA